MEILEIAEVLKSNEQLLSQLYSYCQILFPDYAEEFHNLSLEEQGHACLLDQIINDMKKHPETWQKGNVSLETVRLINKNLRDNLEEIKNGHVSPRFAITFAASTELTLSERDFNHAFKTVDEAFSRSLRAIAEGFSSHYQRIKKLEKLVLGSSSGFDTLNRV
ncbi:MAG: hypothetical protein ACOYXC_08395 [Candidatus Rifleibacteriota bacterium]